MTVSNYLFFRSSSTFTGHIMASDKVHNAQNEKKKEEEDMAISNHVSDDGNTSNNSEKPKSSKSQVVLHDPRTWKFPSFRFWNSPSKNKTEGTDVDPISTDHYPVQKTNHPLLQEGNQVGSTCMFVNI